MRHCYRQISQCTCQYDVNMITFDAFQMQREADLLVFNDVKVHFIDIMGIMN